MGLDLYRVCSWWPWSFGGVDGGEKGEKMEMVFFLLMKMKIEMCFCVYVFGF